MQHLHSHTHTHIHTRTTHTARARARMRPPGLFSRALSLSYSTEAGPAPPPESCVLRTPQQVKGLSPVHSAPPTRGKDHPSGTLLKSRAAPAVGCRSARGRRAESPPLRRAPCGCPRPPPASPPGPWPRLLSTPPDALIQLPRHTGFHEGLLSGLRDRIGLDEEGGLGAIAQAAGGRRGGRASGAAEGARAAASGGRRLRPGGTERVARLYVGRGAAAAVFDSPRWRAPFHETRMARTPACASNALPARAAA
jgi:hypothetical protein